MRKKVFVALRTAGVAGQEKLKGIFRYQPDWDITYIRQAIEFTPELVHKAIKENYDGFIVSIPDTEKTAALLADISTPTIVMDIHDPKLSARKKNIVFIRNSPVEIGRTAANYLMSLGRCRSYAFVHNPSVMEWSVDRYKAFKETLRDHGLFCHQIDDLEDIKLLEKPCGLLAANDDRGFDILDYCRTHKLKVPEDVSVLGINNDTLICENSRPRLSSIQPDFEEEGFLAAQTLDNLMGNARKSTICHLPSTIFVGVKAVVARESTSVASPAGKMVQKALVYIRGNYLRGIGVEDVVRHLGCSRRLADLRFREIQGATIGETIITMRLDTVKKMLLSTRDSIESIGRHCGYDNPNYLKNLFRRRFGMSMSEFRNQLA